MLLATACSQRRITYSLSAPPFRATSVQWTAPLSGTIISGQGTLSLVVQFSGPTSITDTIRVVGVNDCGTSAQRKLKVAALTGSCRSAGKSNEQKIPSTITKAAVTNNTTELDVTVMPNPSQHHFTLQVPVGNSRQEINIQVFDANGRAVESRQNIQSTISVGENWNAGIYFVTILQGTKKKTIRLVKL